MPDISEAESGGLNWGTGACATGLEVSSMRANVGICMVESAFGLRLPGAVAVLVRLTWGGVSAGVSGLDSDGSEPGIRRPEAPKLGMGDEGRCRVRRRWLNKRQQCQRSSSE